MPTAAPAVSMLLVLMAATPSLASPSCMSRTEARQHFGSAYLFWHGRDHCWKAAPPQRHRIAGVRRTIARPKWREPMAQMLPGDEPVSKPVPQPVQTTGQTPPPDRQANIEPSQPAVAARWVDIVQVASPPVIERKPEPKVTPRSAVLAFIAIVLMLGTIEVLFRCTSDERRHAGRDTPPAG